MGYGMWYPPLPEGRTDFVHGYNSACKREVLLSYGELLPRMLLADTAFAHRLRRDGHAMANAPGARIEHLNETGFVISTFKTFLAHRFSTPARADLCEWSAFRRLAYAVGGPLLPFYGFYCQVRLFASRRPRVLWTLLRILPQFLIVQWTMAAGSFAGLLLGPGDSAQTFSNLELNLERPGGKALQPGVA